MKGLTNKKDPDVGDSLSYEKQVNSKCQNLFDTRYVALLAFIVSRIELKWLAQVIVLVLAMYFMLDSSEFWGAVGILLCSPLLAVALVSISWRLKQLHSTNGFISIIFIILAFGLVITPVSRTFDVKLLFPDAVHPDAL